MDDIFEIKFPIELEMKEKVILKFSNKQGGAFNIFSYYWQCFVWAATIGFLRNERRPLQPGTERIFNLNIMRGNGGEKDAQALICMCIARAGTVEIMKNPSEAIQVISEYANGGFYHILKLMENGENTFNDFEKVKQEIFSRDYWNESEDSSMDNQSAEVSEDQITDAETPSDEDVVNAVDDMAIKQAEEDYAQSQLAVAEPRVRKRWSARESTELKDYYKQGMSIEQLAGFFSRSEDSVREQLVKLKLI